jgi:hypothetical protein
MVKFACFVECKNTRAPDDAGRLHSVCLALLRKGHRTCTGLVSGRPSLNFIKKKKKKKQTKKTKQYYYIFDTNTTCYM